ncbi:MAG TPA: hypothetical protein VKA15_01830, partial [Isosphaeraceae bacterium]|nr:hypothetical protein [Isosphaeraceae bacterium]
MENRIEISQHGRDVLAVMNRVLLGERTQSQAAGLLHLSERQVRRIQRRERKGDIAIHGGCLENIGSCRFRVFGLFTWEFHHASI